MVLRLSHRLTEKGESTLNNIEMDLKTRLEEEGTAQKAFAEQIGLLPPYVNRIARVLEHFSEKPF